MHVVVKGDNLTWTCCFWGVGVGGVMLFSFEYVVPPQGSQVAGPGKVTAENLCKQLLPTVDIMGQDGSCSVK